MNVHELLKSAEEPRRENAMHGELYLSRSGWLLLNVPNGLTRAVFSTLREPGIQLPTRDTDDPDATHNAHVSVMRPEEVEQLGGADKITERGHQVPYTIGVLRSVKPAGWNGVSRCWFLEVHSPRLQQIRKSYGLSPLPIHPSTGESIGFHITVAIRKTSVLQDNEIKKAADSLFKTVETPGGPAKLGPRKPPLWSRVGEPKSPLQANYDAYTAQQTSNRSFPATGPTAEGIRQAVRGNSSPQRPSAQPLSSSLKHGPALERTIAAVHGGGPTSLRPLLHAAAAAQGAPLTSPEASLQATELFRGRMHGSQGPSPGERSYIDRNLKLMNFPTDESVVINNGPDQRTALIGGQNSEGFSVPVVANHEIEHMRQPGGLVGYSNRLLREFGPSIGDLLFAGETFNRTAGKPLSHSVQFPSGESRDIQLMIQQGKDHGYFDGRTMDSLLNTTEGQQWLKQIVGDSTTGAAAIAGTPIPTVSQNVPSVELGASQFKGGEFKDPSYCAEHAEECCPNCGARLEQDVYDEKCNRCGGKWKRGESAATKQAADSGLLLRLLLSRPPGDVLPGGLADGKPDSEFSLKALLQGQQSESEHVAVPGIAKEIAKDHLVEDPKYYDKLEKMEHEKTATEVANDRTKSETNSPADQEYYQPSAAAAERLQSGGPQGDAGARTSGVAGNSSAGGRVRRSYGQVFAQSLKGIRQRTTEVRGNGGRYAARSARVKLGHVALATENVQVEADDASIRLVVLPPN